jgi:predicted HTH domain antitoxin
MSLNVTISDSVLQSIHLPSHQVEAELRKEIAIAWYRKGILGFDAARELAQIDCFDFGHLVDEPDVARRCGRFDLNGNPVYTCSE